MADTLKEYAVPARRPVSVAIVVPPGTVAVPPAGEEVTV
jgi:hypothetical protein